MRVLDYTLEQGLQKKLEVDIVEARLQAYAFCRIRGYELTCLFTRMARSNSAAKKRTDPINV